MSPDAALISSSSESVRINLRYSSSTNLTEPDWTGHRDTMEWSRRGRRQNSTAVLGTGLFLSTSPLCRILFPIPSIVTRFKQTERNRQHQEDSEQYADGKI